MLVFIPDELEAARYFAKEAVRVGSENGGQFDWDIATDKLKIALGYAEINMIEYRTIEMDSAEWIASYGNS